jgi:CheY-like chemotaxis protein
MKTLLFVDDDADIRDGLSDLFVFDGWNVVPAGDGLVALEWLARHPAPSVILLDLKMPRCDGYEFRRRQLQEARLARVPTVVLTADGRVSADHSAYLVGLRVLHKPVDWKVLRSAVAACITEAPAARHA